MHNCPSNANKRIVLPSIEYCSLIGIHFNNYPAMHRLQVGDDTTLWCMFGLEEEPQ